MCSAGNLQAGAQLGLRALQDYCRKLLGRKQAALQMYSYADVQRANTSGKVWPSCTLGWQLATSKVHQHGPCLQRATDTATVLLLLLRKNIVAAICCPVQTTHTRRGLTGHHDSGRDVHGVTCGNVCVV